MAQAYPPYKVLLSDEEHPKNTSYGRVKDPGGIGQLFLWPCLR